MRSVTRTGWLALALCAALLSGCAGEDGANGAPGADGRTALVSTAAEAAGANCAAGGVRVDAGIDADADGVLDAAEVTSTQYVCDGGTGPAGAVALVNVAAEPAGANCADGGTRIDSGLDADADGALDPAEVAATQYACDGVAGATGQPGAPGAVALMTLTAEAAGAHCIHGGTRVDSGLDADADGVLDPAEVAATEYVCSPDTYDPEVLAVDPAPGSISNGVTFTVTFSEAVDPTTVDGTSVYLVLQEDWDGLLVDLEVVPATVSYDDATHTAALVPVAQLMIDYPYSLRVTPHVRDLEGNTLPEFVASYWVGADGAAPRVVQVSPVDGGVAGPWPRLALTFDEGLNWDSGQVARITLADSQGTEVAGDSWWDGWNGVYFDPHDFLTDGERYTASIDAIVADSQGNWTRLTMDWSFSVDAAPPGITGAPVVSPASQAAGGLVEIAVPVSARARYAEILMGDDWNGWYTGLGTLDGNWNGEGTITGTVTVAYPPAAGAYSVWVILYDENWNYGSHHVASTASAVNYTTWNSLDATPMDSTIPLAFLGVTDPTWVDLAATVEFVPGAGGAGDVAYTITNFGTGDAGPFVVGIYVNPESSPALYSVPDYWLDFGGLAAGATSSGTIPVSGLPVTETAVHAIADLTASISEADEGNNFASHVHVWGPLP